MYPDKSVRANLAVSDDGLNFLPLNNGNPVTGRAADTFIKYGSTINRADIDYQLGLTLERLAAFPRKGA